MSTPKGYPVASTTFVNVELDVNGTPNGLSTGPGTFVPMGNYATTSVPVLIAPNGTIATTGVVTLGTALPVIYARAWVWFPAGAVVGGAAGLYYTTFSSTTVGQVTSSYVATFTPSQVQAPAAPINAVGSNAAYTQTTAADLALITYTLPGNSLGVNGQLRCGHEVSVTNSAGVKTYNIKFGGTIIATTGVTTVAQVTGAARIRNRGVANAQVFPASSTGGAQGTTAAAIVQAAIDTTVAQTVVYSGNLATATDFVVIEGVTIESFPW